MSWCEALLSVKRAFVLRNVKTQRGRTVVAMGKDGERRKVDCFLFSLLISAFNICASVFKLRSFKTAWKSLAGAESSASTPKSHSKVPGGVEKLTVE